ncbi:hypothetical protein [Streptosporangium sandarakinum]|uniref:Uncharacterized protein n=1 Tax=Streptosporangium sandarakinum TaxID=1260955 RepID=A0A852V988_9ACTN|nr:hypothetical protein [Streptosporangium sandarakinum]NYF44660.1 hypothetical protein [Streptosporangium sandarakinum]
MSRCARLTTGVGVDKPALNSRYDRPDPDEAIPGHLARTPSRPFWLRAIEEDDDARHRRRDWWATTMTVVWQLATRTGRDLVTCPGLGATWRVLAEAAGVSRTTLSDRLRWLRRRGYLFVLVPGSTPQYRSGTLCGLLDDGLGNLAAEYVLTVPAELVAGLDAQELSEVFPAPDTAAADDWRDVPWPAETLPVEESRTPPVALADVGAERDATPGAGARDARAIPHLGWLATATPGTKAEMLRACERLRAEDATLRKVSARHLRSLLRPLFAAGATPRDVQHALNREPDGRIWAVSRDLYAPAGWVRWRVRAWVAEDGTLRAPLPSQVAAAADRARRAEQAARAADWARRQATRAAPGGGYAAAARAELDAALGRLAARRVRAA